MSTMTFKERVASHNLPMLMWSRYEEERFWGNIWQHASMLSTAVFIGSTVAMNMMSGDFFTLISVVSFLLTIASTASYFAYYSTELAAEKEGVKESIKTAAEKAIDCPQKNVKLSDYLSPGLSFGRRYDYLETLSKRHIKWAKKYYLKQIDAIKYERTEGLRRKEDKLCNVITSLDDIDTTRIRKISYHLDAIKKLERERPASATEQLEQELSRL